MFLWLLRNYGSILDIVVSRTTGDSRLFQTARIAAASVTSFMLVLLWGPRVILWLKQRFRERIASASETLNELHASKQETPTMGGIFIVAAVLASVWLWGDLSSELVHLASWTMFFMMLLGAVDDWVKQRSSKRGLSVRQKLIAQAVIGITAGFFLQGSLVNSELVARASMSSTWQRWLPAILFVFWCALVFVATTNAVNLTDGLDGLATGCTVTTAAAYSFLAYVGGNSVLSGYFGAPFVPSAGELAVVLAALVGAMMGFLWFNCFPAQVFMGDAGSLAIGGLLSIVALAIRQEITLLLIGGVFVVETFSVILQVLWFRSTGKRILRCSPLHNHFVFRGDHEVQIVVRFWIASAIFAIVGIASLKLR